MRFILISLAVIVQLTQSTAYAALLHECHAFIVPEIYNQEASSPVPHFIITNTIMSSMLFYNILDTENSNIPLSLNSEDIKTYLNDFTVCGLQDVDSEYCREDQLGCFTVRFKGHRSIQHPTRNELLQPGLTTPVRIPYSGVWCLLLYQDGNYQQGTTLTTVQQWGHLSVDQKNESVVLRVLIGFEILTMLTFALVLRQKVYGEYKQLSTKLIILMFLSLVGRCYNILELNIMNTKDGDSSISFVKPWVIPFVVFCESYFYYLLWSIAKESCFTLSHDAKQNNRSIILLFPITLILALLTLIEGADLLIPTLSWLLTPIRLTIEGVIWIALFKRSSHTSAEIRNPIALKNFQRARIAIILVPSSFFLAKWLLLVIYSVLQAWVLPEVQSKTVRTLASQANIDFVYALVRNLDKWAFLAVIIGVTIVWERRGNC